MIHLKNISGSPASINPKWQGDFISKIEPELQDKLANAAEEFKAKAAAAIENAAPGYAGVAIHNIMRELPRFHFVKNLDVSGKLYDVQVDLLLHEVLFIEV